MAKFLDKKEQVIDFQLTTYGRYLLSVSGLKPTYYAFFDDNVIYDGRYANAKNGQPAPPTNTTAEPQNDIHNRIKNETQYIESLTLFEGVESSDSTNDGTVNFFDLQDLAAKKRMRKDAFRFDAAIGDANLDGEIDKAPAWKVVTLQGQISSSFAKDNDTNPSGSINIPQINIDADYLLRTREPQAARRINSDLRIVRLTTQNFKDNRIIVLEQADPVIYVEEVNTQLLAENFDIQIFDKLTNTDNEVSLERKFFKTIIPQIKNGIMISPKRVKTPEAEITSGSVEYYFDVLADSRVNRVLACRGLADFNKDSYYIDLDFDCDREEDEDVFFDIYGSVTEPEICR
jgi:hypothetical protein